MLVNNFFWRTYDRQEIDWVEERGGKLYGTITPENFRERIS